MLNNLNFLPENSSAIVMGANGGIGKAILKTIKSKYKFKNVFGLSRKSEIYINYYSEESIKKAAEYFLSESLNIRLIINCAGYLYDKEFLPEKSIKDIDINYAESFKKATNLNLEILAYGCKLSKKSIVINNKMNIKEL